MKNLNYYLELNYEIKIRRLTDKEGGGWLAEIPLLPGCMSDGKTPEDAIVNLADAKKCWLETCMGLKRPVPEPHDFSGQLRVRMPKSLHRTLSKKAKEENVSLNQYINYQLARSVGYTANGRPRRRVRLGE